MFSFTCGGVAVSVASFVFYASSSIVDEYSPLYLRQLGLTATYIGLIPLFGFFTQLVGVPLVSYVADKLRARKLLLLLVIVFTIPSILLFLLPRYPQSLCETYSTNSSIVKNATKQSSDPPKESLNHLRMRLIKGNAFLHHKNQTIDEIVMLFMANRSSDTSKDEETHSGQLNFLLQMIFLRGLFELFRRLTATMLTVAVMTHTENDKTKYGYYACWGEIGEGLALFVVGITVSRFSHLICSNSVPDYSLAFIFAAVFQSLTMLSLSWLKFKYLEHRVMNYTEVKGVLCRPHYMLLLIIACHGGLCLAFQSRWEFWYIKKLGGDPVVMAVGGLVRSPVRTLWFILSRSIVDRLGELIGVAVSLLIFAVSFAFLAFVRNPWLVVVLDFFQSLAFVLIFASIVIHFSKAGSSASSATIQGTVTLMYHGVGKEIGTALIGWLFTSYGTTITLCCYSLTAVAFLLVFTIYLFTAKDLDSYTLLEANDSDDEK